MRLLEVETRHWRGLTHALGPLSPGLNLVLGPNETGKSRLFQAIQYALFESFKGAAQHKQRLQSWQSADSPFVRLAFELNGRQYELQKQFLKGASAQLSGGGQTLRGEDAETELRSLLGTRAGNSRGWSVEEAGIWPLLMVAQGNSRRGTGEDLNEDGRAKLHERLAQEIGVAAISDSGRRLLDRAEEERGRYYTPSGQESTLLRNARRAAEEAERKYQEALATQRSREDTAVALRRARSELDDLKARFEAARGESERAQQVASAAQKAAEQLATAQGALNTAVAMAEGAERDLAARREADETIRRLGEEAETLNAQLNDLNERQQGLQLQYQEVQKRATAAEEAHRNAAAALEIARRERRRRELTERQTELQAKADELKRIGGEIEAAQGQRARELAIDAPGVARLQRLEEAARTAKDRLHGAAVSVVVRLRQATEIDGVAHPAGASIAFDVVENRTLLLGQLAELEIRPGLGTLDKLRDARLAADAALAEALKDCGAESVSEARSSHEQRVALDRQIVQLNAQMAAVWPKSRDSLREELLRIAADLGRLGPIATAEGTEEALQAALVAAEEEMTSARAAREAASKALTGAQSEAAAQSAARQGKLEEQTRLSSQYAERPTAAVLQGKHGEALQARGLAQQALERCRQQFDDLGGEEAHRDAQRLARATQALSEQMQTARGLVERLTGTLNVALGGGSYESLQETEAELNQARKQLQRLEQRAAAADRLWTLLSEERRKVVERLTAPVMQRVRPYLVSLFPGSELELGEELGTVGLRSDSLSEPFEELSGGAQEQLGLLTRLGLAEVLAAEGTLPLVLDDSLVNTDPERIRRIHRVLYRAAEKLQVLVMSCHDVLFDGLGAERIFKLNGARR